MGIKAQQAHLANPGNLFKENPEMLESKVKPEIKVNQDLGDLTVKQLKENQVLQETQE